MKSEHRQIKSLSKKILPKHQYKKAKKIPSRDERTESLKYLMTSKLKLKLLELELNSREIEKKEALLVDSKLKLLESKIRIFESTHKKRDYDVLQNLIQEIEKEIKCSSS